jgi:phosphopantetheinyl transferase
MLELDIEVSDPSRDIDGISEIAFHPSDQLWSPHPDTERVSAFYHLWSNQEALHRSDR